jgi:hypothetical protein
MRFMLKSPADPVLERHGTTAEARTQAATGFALRLWLPRRILWRPGEKHPARQLVVEQDQAETDDTNHADQIAGVCRPPRGQEGFREQQAEHPDKHDSNDEISNVDTHGALEQAMSLCAETLMIFVRRLDILNVDQHT